MSIRPKIHWLIPISFFFIACQAFYQLTSPSTNNQAASESLTQAAQYLNAALTLTALAQQPTPTAEIPTPTPSLEPTQEMASEPPAAGDQDLENNPLQTPIFVAKLPTPTDTPPAMATAAACRYAANLDYETIPAGKEIPLNHKFTKMWRLRNSGNSEWNTDFVLICTKNCDLFGGGSTIPIANRAIKPKEQIEVRVELRAPKDKKLVNKKVTATWMIRGGGKVFGVQPDGKSPLSITITLVD